MGGAPILVNRFNSNESMSEEMETILQVNLAAGLPR